jgi:hypothetical protein
VHQSAIETVLTLTSDGRFVGDTGGRLRYIPSNDRLIQGIVNDENQEQSSRQFLEQLTESFQGLVLRFDDVQLTCVASDHIAFEAVFQLLIADALDIPQLVKWADKFVSSHVLYFDEQIIVFFGIHESDSFP